MAIGTTAFYTALLALVLIVLSIRVIGVRRSRQISLGDGNDADLRGRIRAHGNFTEYTPMALLLMAGVEGYGFDQIIVHGLGLALLAGRISHAAAVSPVQQIMPLRVAGMTLTLGVISASALLVIVCGLASLMTGN